jgi:hypothetical protein
VLICVSIETAPCLEAAIGLSRSFTGILSRQAVMLFSPHCSATLSAIQRGISIPQPRGPVKTTDSKSSLGTVCEQDGINFGSFVGTVWVLLGKNLGTGSRPASAVFQPKNVVVEHKGMVHKLGED